MIQLKHAIEEEIKKNYLEAIKIYEEIINTDEPPLDAFINLSFIYWEFAAEFSFRELYNITGKWGDVGDKRFDEILKKGLIIYPNNLELHFWKRYFPHRLYFDEFSESDCHAIISKFGGDNLVPYFFLYLHNKENYKTQRDLLLQDCKKCLTAKNEYIISLISS